MRKQKVGTGTFFNFEGWDTVSGGVGLLATQFQIYFIFPTFDFN